MFLIKKKTSSGALFATLRAAAQKTINALCAEKKLPSLKTVHTNAAAVAYSFFIYDA